MRNPRSPAERAALLETGARLLSEGRFFDAHESFEDLWHSTDDPSERDVWQGMAQIAAALVKHARRDEATARSLLAKARGHLDTNPRLLDHAAPLQLWLDELGTRITGRREIPSAPVDPELMEAFRGLLTSPR